MTEFSSQVALDIYTVTANDYDLYQKMLQLGRQASRTSQDPGEVRRRFSAQLKDWWETVVIEPLDLMPTPAPQLVREVVGGFSQSVWDDLADRYLEDVLD